MNPCKDCKHSELCSDMGECITGAYEDEMQEMLPRD